MGPEDYSTCQRAYFDVYRPETLLSADHETRLLTATLPALESQSWEEGLPLWKQSWAHIPPPSSPLAEMYLNVARHGSLGILAEVCGEPTIAFTERRRECLAKLRLAEFRETPFNLIWYSHLTVSLGSLLVQWRSESQELSLSRDELKAVLDVSDVDFKKSAHLTLSFLDSTQWDLDGMGHEMARLVQSPKELENANSKCVETIVRMLDVVSVFVGVRELIDQMKEHPHGEAILVGYVHEDIRSIRNAKRLVGEIIYPDKNHSETSVFDDSHLNFDILASAAKGIEGALTALRDGIESVNAKEVEAALMSVYKGCERIVDV